LSTEKSIDRSSIDRISPVGSPSPPLTPRPSPPPPPAPRRLAGKPWTSASTSSSRSSAWRC
jgi:hypothetical protein